MTTEVQESSSLIHTEPKSLEPCQDTPEKKRKIEEELISEKKQKQDSEEEEDHCQSCGDDFQGAVVKCGQRTDKTSTGNGCGHLFCVDCVFICDCKNEGNWCAICFKSQKVICMDCNLTQSELVCSMCRNLLNGDLAICGKRINGNSKDSRGGCRKMICFKCSYGCECAGDEEFCLCMDCNSLGIAGCIRCSEKSDSQSSSDYNPEKENKSSPDSQ